MPTYYDLVISCPVCLSKGRSGGKPSQWYHANCGGKLQIGENACLKCTLCKNEDHLKNWRYVHDSTEADFRPITTSTSVPVNPVTLAMTLSNQIIQSAGMSWLITLLKNMEDD